MYNQYVNYLDPCPLCILQRLAFLVMGGIALLAVIHNPDRVGQQIYSWLFVLAAIMGALVAGRHVWLQSLPPELVPECGPGLNYMLENFPLKEVFSKVFYGDGSCAEVKWKFIGMTMPMWTFAWYAGLGVITLWIVSRPSRRRAVGN